MTLQKYYTTTHWRKFRNSLLQESNVECEICGRRGWTQYLKNTKKHKKGDKKRLITLSVHHKTYKNLGHENREDVLVLCRFCHDLSHSLERASIMSPNPYLKIYNLLKKLTKWDYAKRN